MNHRATREIERTHLMEPSVDAPHPMSERVVNERRPKETKDKEAAKRNSLRECTRDKRGCDDGEHALEDHIGLMGYRRRIAGIRRGRDYIVEPDPIQPAHESQMAG